MTELGSVVNELLGLGLPWFRWAHGKFPQCEVGMIAERLCQHRWGASIGVRADFQHSYCPPWLWALWLLVLAVGLIKQKACK